MKSKQLVMQLQLFSTLNNRCKQPLLNADNGAGSGGAGSPEGKSKDDPEGGESKSLDNINDIIFKKIAEEKAKWEKDYETKLNNAKIEAEKLAKMNADEKAKYEREKKEAELNKREQEITTRELQATAKTILIDKGLPVELYEILNYADADTCNASIDAVEKSFQSAVEKAVNDKLRGNGAPKSGNGNNGGSQGTSQSAFMNAIYKNQVKR